ncbi:TPA: hypothetical protein QDB44_001313 [Burkholderia vietnamiensis]|nr:hypothetical protein [Burkholderia vietnamiensis]
MATLLDNVTHQSDGQIAWKIGAHLDKATDLTGSDPPSGAGQFSVELRENARTLGQTRSHMPTGYAIRVASAPVSDIVHRNAEAQVQRNAVEGVINYFDANTVMSTVVGLRDELRVDLPRALFPEHIAEGNTFTIEMTVGLDGFRTPLIKMVRIEPTETVTAIHDEIRAILASL